MEKSPLAVEPTFSISDLAVIYAPSDVLINLSLAFLLGLMISGVYKYTHRGLSYSQSFTVTLVVVAFIVAMVMMVIGNNLARAFALVGALSIIRFRTVVKDTKDIGFIFMSLAAGLAAGTSSYFLSIAGTGFFGVVAVILHVTNYGSLYKSEFILRFRSEPPGEGAPPVYSRIFAELTKSASLLHVEPSGDGQSTKLTFDIVMKNNIDPKDLTRQIAVVDGLSEVILVASKNDADY